MSNAYFQRGLVLLGTMVIVGGAVGLLFAAFAWMQPGPSVVEVHHKSDLNLVRQVNDLAVSPDGKTVFAISSATDVLLICRRDSETGRLSIANHYQSQGNQDRVPGAVPLEDFGSQSAVAISPDQQFLYVAAGAGQAIFILRVDSDRTELTPTGLYQVQGGTFDRLAISPDGLDLFGLSSDGLFCFRRDIPTGKLTVGQIFQDERAGRQDDQIGTMFERIPSASRIDGLLFPSSCVVSPDGKHVYVAARESDAVALFSRDATTGKLSFLEAFKENPNRRVADAFGLSNPWSMAISGDGKQLVVVGISGLGFFDRDATTGRLTPHGKLHSSDPVAADLRTANRVVFSPDDRTIYVTSRNRNALVVLDRKPDVGHISIRSVTKDNMMTRGGLKTPESLAISPDGQHLYIGTEGGALGVFKTDPSESQK